MSGVDDSSYARRLRERLARNPDSKLFLAFAEEYRDRGETGEAIALMVEGIRRNPDFLHARLTLGRWYLSMNMPSEAKSEFSEIIRQSPHYLSAHKWLAVTHKMLGDNEAALREYKKIIEIEPQSRLCSEARREMAIERLLGFLKAIQRHFAQPAPPSTKNFPQHFA